MKQVPIFILLAALLASVGAFRERAESAARASAAQSPTPQQPLAGVVVALPAVALLMAQPATLRSVHELLERLMH